MEFLSGGGAHVADSRTGGLRFLPTHSGYSVHGFLAEEQGGGLSPHNQ